MLERLFQLQAHGTTVRKEVVAGITTCLAATIGTLIMGLWANDPTALAPDLGDSRKLQEEGLQVYTVCSFEGD